MARRTWQVATIVVAGLIVVAAIYSWQFLNSQKLPSTAQLLSDEQMQNIRGGHKQGGELICCCYCCPNVGKNMRISASHGVLWTEVPICTIESAEGSTVDLRLHYDSGKADGTIWWWQTVLGYGWTHNYNTHLIVRSLEVLMPDGTGRMTLFRKRFDGSYTSSPGEFHTLSQVDPNTFLLEEVDGSKRTFELFDPTPWPEGAQLFQLTQIKDAQGRVTTLGYNGQGLLETITDPYGRQVSFTYNANKRIETITNADGQVTQIEYQNADDDLWRITDPLGYMLEYTYDSQNRMTTEKLKDGNIWSCIYNNGKPYQLLDGDGQIYATVTNSANWAIDLDYLLQFGEVRYIPSQTTITDGCGNETVYHHDENGYVTKTEYADGTQKTYEFNDDLRRIKETDEEGNFWLYEYDEHGNRIKATDPLGNETEMFYEHPNIPSLLTKQIEPDSDEWVYEYDPNGNLITEIDPIVESPNDAVITHTYDANGLRTSTTDRNGHVTQWEYDSNGMMIREIVDPCGLDIITEYEYDAAGRRIRQIIYRGPGLTDPIVTTYEYDTMGQLIQETIDPCGLALSTQYERDGAGRIVDQNNPRGVITHYEYDARGQLVTKIVDPNGLNLTTRYEYDNCDNRTKLIDPRGCQTTYEYDSRNRLIKTIDAENYWTLYEYDTRGNQTRVSRSIDPCGPPYRVTEYQYDELSRRTHTIVDPNGLNLTTVYEYAPPGSCGCTCGTPGSLFVHKMTDPASKVTYYYYDHLDRQTSEVRKVGDINDNGGDANDAITTYEYDYMGNQIQVTVENAPHPNMVTAYDYDAADRLIKEVQGPNDANLVTAYGYDNTGNIIQETTRVGNVITSTYDNADRLINQSDLIGAITSYTYDANGNILTQADGLGHTWTYIYDSTDRLTNLYDSLVETPTDKCTIYEYDDNGNLIKITDNEGLVTTYTYDYLDRRITMTEDPDGVDVTIQYTHNGHNNLVQITDDNGNTTSYEYDAANRKIKELYADGTDVSFVHDPVGNIVSRTDQMDNVTTYSYDDLNRLITRSYANGITDTFTYDRAGRMLTADNDRSHIGYTYDDVGWIISSTQTDLPQTYSYIVAYDYNTIDNTCKITYPSGKVVLEARDVRNRLSEVWQDGIKTTWYTYENPSDRILSKHFANGTHSEYAYNDNDWITELRHIDANGTSTFAGFAHNYDAVGNGLDANNLQDVLAYDANKPVTQSEKYGYDSIYRLVDFKRGQLVGGDIPSPTRTRTWQLDGVHNWTQFSIDANNYYNSINQMNEYDDPSTDGLPPVPDDDGLPDDFMVGPDDFTADLDSDGIIGLLDLAIFASDWLDSGISDLNNDGIVDFADFAIFAAGYYGKTGLNFAHDKNGNLADDDIHEYCYDYQTSITSSVRGLNQMTMVKDKASGETLGQYWYDALGRRICKLSGDANTVYVYTYNWRAIEEYENGALARSYAYGGWIDEVLTMDRASEGNKLYYHSNALGSIIALSDDAGAPTECYTYDAYGQPSFSDGNGNSITQSAIGNPYLFTARRLDDETGLYYYRARYYDSAKGRFMQRDLKGYLDGLNLYRYVNNPINMVDPLGLCTQKFSVQIGEAFLKILEGFKKQVEGSKDKWKKYAGNIIDAFNIFITSLGKLNCWIQWQGECHGITAGPKGDCDCMSFSGEVSAGGFVVKHELSLKMEFDKSGKPSIKWEECPQKKCYGWEGQLELKAKVYVEAPGLKIDQNLGIHKKPFSIYECCEKCVYK